MSVLLLLVSTSSDVLQWGCCQVVGNRGSVLMCNESGFLPVAEFDSIFVRNGHW